MPALWIVLGAVVLIAIFLWLTYNSLVTLKIRVDEAWSDITVQLKRRLDLIPNLVNTVKGYAAHETGVFEKVTEARANALSAQGPQQTATTTMTMRSSTMVKAGRRREVTLMVNIKPWE